MIAAESQCIAWPLLTLSMWKNLVTLEKSLTFISFTCLYAALWASISHPCSLTHIFVMGSFFIYIKRHFLISKVVSLLNLSIDYIQPSRPTSLLEIFALSDPGKHFTCGNFFLEKVFIVLKYNAYNYKPQKCIKMKVTFHCHFYLYIFILFYFICG